MDDFFEQTVTRSRKGMHETLYYISRVALVGFAIYALMNLSSIFGAKGFDIASVILALISGGMIYVIWRFADDLRMEYDYTFTNGSIDIARVSNAKRRKQLITLDSKQIIRFGVAGGQAYEKCRREPGVKQHNWYLDPDSKLYFMYFQSKGEKQLIVFQPSAEFVELLRSRKYLNVGVWCAEGEA